MVHCKKEPYDVYVGRPSIWGNPFPLERESERLAVYYKYKEWLLTQPELLRQIPSLRGKVLGCWCAPKLCHGNLLADLADQEMPLHESD